MAKCEQCPWRRKAEAKPNSWMARLWRWHTRWCPGWKAYMREQKTKKDNPEAS